MSAKKSKVKEKYIAVGDNSDCQHDEFTSVVKAAQDAVDNEMASGGSTIRVYKFIGEYEVSTKVTIKPATKRVLSAEAVRKAVENSLDNTMERSLLEARGLWGRL